ncbi:MAG: hypothetical protein J7J32_04080 [Candidatus Atribacteria bacterium]|nr:hypothetical protein [Candidatus Atribacteria bacterium]MCD6349219.1 hypothetical protein [Candidatus Atribacteria bacterium]
MPEDLIAKIKQYEELLKETLKASEKYLGIISVKLLVERVKWDVSKEYREIEYLQYSEEGLSLQALVDNLKNTSDFPVNEMFKKFLARYVEILAKLVGEKEVKNIVKKLPVEELDNSFRGKR